MRSNKTVLVLILHTKKVRIREVNPPPPLLATAINLWSLETDSFKCHNFSYYTNIIIILIIHKLLH